MSERCTGCYEPLSFVCFRCDAEPAPRWTTTPPTEPGWYWAVFENKENEIEIVEVVESTVLVAIRQEYQTIKWSLYQFSHWLRIEMPEMPK